MWCVTRNSPHVAKTVNGNKTKTETLLKKRSLILPKTRLGKSVFQCRCRSDGGFQVAASLVGAFNYILHMLHSWRQPGWPGTLWDAGGELPASGSDGAAPSRLTFPP